MRYKAKTAVVIVFILVNSCGSNKDSKNNEHPQSNYVQIFNEMNENPPEIIYPIEFYKNKIIGYRNFFDERQVISAITEVQRLIPGYLCYLVCWFDNLKGYMHELFVFDKNQNIARKYLVGYGPLISNYTEILMEKLPGTRIEHELVSVGDFNNDGINEILSYSLYPNIGYVFTVFGYNVFEDELIETCLAPVFINFEKPFPPVEYIGNGFKILEVVDSEPLELAWNVYTWNVNTAKWEK